MTDTVKVVVWIVMFVAIGLVIIGTLANEFPTITSLGKGLQKYIFFGKEDLSSEVATKTTSGEIGGLITAFMIWLIIFAGFGDIIENFAAFSKGIAWVIAFAIAVVAANTGLISKGMVVLIGWFAWAGTYAMFLALFASFFFFILVNWGVTPLMGWIRGRQEMVDAARGRTTAASGLKTLKVIGEESAKPTS